jgi:uridine kinase
MAAYLVGIAGGSGSGKTTLISMIQAELGADNVSVISQDDYYLSKEEQVCDSNGELNFDLPSAIDSERLFSDVKTLLDGQDVELKRYTFNNLNDLSNRITIKSMPIIIVEGLFVFHFSELVQQFDFKIFIDAEAETRFNRRLVRDMNERGYPEEVVRYQWEHHVEPAYRAYLLPHRAHANVIIDNEFEMRHGLQEVLDRLKEVSVFQSN